MALNIKNERVSRLAVELAQLTGESITDAVKYALEARLAELRRCTARDQIAKRLAAIGRECAREAPAGWTERDFDAELYDERGLPR